MSKRQRLSTEETLAEIEGFSHDGRGIARIKGKTTFIAGALPGEQVTFQYTRIKADFDEGKLVSVLAAAKARIEPRCPHYAFCGGCSLQQLDELTQIKEKQNMLLDLLRRFGRCEPLQVLKPLTGSPWHYRNKARLSVRYVNKKGRTLIGFREKINPRFITEINVCSILNQRVSDEISNLRLLIDSFDDPSLIAQIEVAAGDSQIALIFRNLRPLSLHDEEKLRQYGQRTHFLLFLQPGSLESVSLFYPKEESPFLTYTLAEQQLVFQFHPTDFIQINASLNRSMVSLAIELMALTPADSVLDLFCGLGNFSLPMAQICERVIGVEGSLCLVKRAQMNAQNNKIFNAEFLCADLDKMDSISSLSSHKVTNALLDPPRSGALEIVKQIDKFNLKRLVYVSCNPATLARDAAILTAEKGFRLSACGVIDMFPQTAHVESIALFEKGSSYG